MSRNIVSGDIEEEEAKNGMANIFAQTAMQQAQRQQQQ